MPPDVPCVPSRARGERGACQDTLIWCQVDTCSGTPTVSTPGSRSPGGRTGFSLPSRSCRVLHPSWTGAWHPLPCHTACLLRGVMRQPEKTGCQPSDQGVAPCHAGMHSRPSPPRRVRRRHRDAEATDLLPAEVLPHRGVSEEKRARFTGTSHPRLQHGGSGTCKLFERVPCLSNPYLRPASASWRLCVPRTASRCQKALACLGPGRNDLATNCFHGAFPLMPSSAVRRFRRGDILFTTGQKMLCG